ncbi:MAG TPA: hypothetical protein ENH13_04280 [Euryarchaeota archaeon]|nr:hypothetical protein [Euryarchaeota archaeon]
MGIILSFWKSVIIGAVIGGLFLFTISGNTFFLLLGTLNGGMLGLIYGVITPVNTTWKKGAKYGATISILPLIILLLLGASSPLSGFGGLAFIAYVFFLLNVVIAFAVLGALVGYGYENKEKRFMSLGIALGMLFFFFPQYLGALIFGAGFTRTYISPRAIYLLRLVPLPVFYFIGRLIDRSKFPND